MTELQNLKFDAEQVGLIKRMVAKDATDDELKMFLHQAQRMGLDPLAKQIYFRKNRTKDGFIPTIITGIDGYRLTADRTGKYCGSDDAIFDDEENPRRATVTVYKLVGGIRCPFTASARWDQYYPGDAQGFMWRKMPHLMLGKCAEALALRKAFPAELSGAYIAEEMHQAGIIIDAETVTAPIAAKPDPGFDPQNRSHQNWFIKEMKKRSITDDRWDPIGLMLKGRPSSDLEGILAKEATQ